MGTNAYYVPNAMIKEVMDYTRDTVKYTFDLKKNIILLDDFQTNTIYDLNLAAYLLNQTTKDDIAVLMNNNGITMDFYHDIIKNKLDYRTDSS